MRRILFPPLRVSVACHCARFRPVVERLEERAVPTVVIGPEFPVNRTTAANAIDVHTAAARNGLAVVVWAQSSDPSAGPGNSTVIRAQRFNAAGQRVGSEIAVTGMVPIDFNDTAGANDGLDVAMDDAGDFVVAWSQRSGADANVYARRFSAGGTALGSRISVAARGVAEHSPHMAMDPHGNFVVTYQTSSGVGGGTGDVNGVRYLADGRPARTFVVYTSFTRNAPAIQSDVAMAPDGRFAVAFTFQTSSGAGLTVRYFTPLADSGVTIRALRGGLQLQSNLALAMDNRADAVVAVGRMESTGFGTTGEGVFAFRVTPAGGRGRGIVIDNSTGVLYDVALDRTGGTFVVAWGNQQSPRAFATTNLRLTEVTTNNLPAAPRTVTPGLSGLAPALFGAALATRTPGRFLLVYAAAPDGSTDANVFGRLGTF
jgi:hypothetical protein